MRKTVLFVLLLGLALRIANGWFHINMIYPDEQFQTLEPANWVVTGIGWRSWEWYYGLRSWVVPGLYMPLLWMLKGFGIVGTPVSIQACRAFTGLFGGLSLFAFWRLLRQSGFQAMASWLALLLLAFSPAMVVWASSTFSETWAMALLWIAMPYVCQSVAEPSQWLARRWWLAGLLVGVTFLLRLQMVIWAVAFFLTVVACYRPPWRLLAAAALGYLTAVVIQGLLDWATWGIFLHTVWTQYRINVTQGLAAANGTSPMWDYGPQMWSSLGPVYILLPVVACAVALLVRSFHLRRRDALVIVPALIFLIVHSCIGHKETRFVMPVFPALPYILAMGLTSFQERGEKAWRWIAHPAVGGALALALTAACWAEVPKVYPTFGDIGDLSARMAAERSQGPGDCLLLVDQYWIWTRGEMIQGRATEFHEFTLANLKPDDLAKCRYAIVAAGREEGFRQMAGSPWRLVLKNPGGHTLFLRDRL